MRKCKSFFDFINVELYTNPERYLVRLGMKYWIYSEKKQEYQEYKVTEGLTWEILEPYFKKGLLYVE